MLDILTLSDILSLGHFLLHTSTACRQVDLDEMRARVDATHSIITSRQRVEATMTAEISTMRLDIGDMQATRPSPPGEALGQCGTAAPECVRRP